MGAQQIEAAAKLPSAALLSNGRYSVVVESDGGGHATYEGHLLSPRLGYGTSFYVHDADQDLTLSAGSKAISAKPEAYGAEVGPGSYRIRRAEDGIRIATDICVVPERDAELRRFTLTNESAAARRLTLTAVTEVVQARAGDVDIRTGAVPGALAVRKQPDGKELFWLHSFVPSADEAKAFAADRDSFFGQDGRNAQPPGIGNGRHTAEGDHPLLGLRLTVDLEPAEERSITLACCAAWSRQDVLATAEALASEQALADAYLEAALYEQRTRDALKIGPRNADRYHRVGAAILRGEPLLKASPPSPSPEASKQLPLGQIEAGRDPVRRLGLDPTRPLTVCRVSDESEMHVVNLMLKARAFWLSLGLKVQLLILNDQAGAGADAFQQKLHEVVELDDSADEDVVLRHSDVVTPDDQRAVQNSADLVLTADRIGLLRVAK